MAILLVIVKEVYFTYAYYSDSFSSLSVLIVLAVALLSIYIIINCILKRAWDIGLSRKWTYFLIATLPLLSVLVHIYLCLAPPKRGANDGASKLDEESETLPNNNEGRRERASIFKTPLHRIFALISIASLLFWVIIAVLGFFDCVVYSGHSFGEYMEEFVEILALSDEYSEISILGICFVTCFYLSILGWFVAFGCLDWLSRIFQWIKTGR